eukprot:Plantae.Rhodophyta-Palmaria_palmata.ctg9147.p1 GENE.Plantae.Rhodophyta-Palmaria_palmata.ctg9147~~Plantae.Rhodophyta-Palmaria_palmata.ctg9147.p1  ORF type:complete len:283 (-),score=22.58 Plantae.Rhodophyta-Palmaria_palmata.ctg9147:265-1113(-)
MGVRAAYVRGVSRQVYDNIRHAHHPALFHDYNHFGPDIFDHLYEIAREHIAKTFDLFLAEEADGSFAKKLRARLFGNKEIFFLLLAILGGVDEGGVGLRKIAAENGVSPATISRYFEHACVRSYTAMKGDPDRLRWENDDERAEHHGLVPGFPLCVGFVDGAKLGRPRPEDEAEQERVFDGRKHCHCFPVLVWNNPLGQYISIDITDLGAIHDRRFYDQMPPYVSPGEYFNDGEHLLADCGFIGDGAECVCPLKKGMGLDFALRGVWNRSIRAVRTSSNLDH